jgi:hypothetical protein
MKKIGLLCLALVVALGMLGAGYAMWSDQVVIEGTVDTATLTIGFQEVFVTEDAEAEGKEVGSITGYMTDQKGLHYIKETGLYEPIYDRIVVTLNNTYPCYWGHVIFTLANGGTLPGVIAGLDLIDPTGELEFMWTTPPPASPAWGLFWKDLNGNGVYDPPVVGDPFQPGERIILVKYVDNFGVQLEPCGEVKSELDLHVEQAAEQGHIYSFEARITFVQWNKYEG